MRWLLCLGLAACARPTLDARAWNDTPPAAPCTADVLYHDGMGDARTQLRYDAAGHVVFGTTRLTYGGHGWERVTWDGDRPVAFDTYDEEAEQEDFCDDGCGEPASRRIDHVDLGYDGAELVSFDQHAQIYVRDGDGWTRVKHPHGRDRYHYDRGRVVEIDKGLASLEGSVNGTVHLDYDGDRVTRRRFDRLTDTFAWKDGRLAGYHWMGYDETYRYDDAGRLVEDDTVDTAADGEDVVSTWTYDYRGRLVAKDERDHYHGAAASSDNLWTWTYDADGRLVAATNGGTTTAITFSGVCPKGLGVPPPPDPLTLAGAGVCVTSPGYVYNTCSF